MAEPTEVLDFTPHDGEGAAAVVTRMREQATAHRGWTNLAPAVPPEHRPPPAGGLGPVFGARGKPVPLATWMPGTVDRRGAVGPTQLGVQHGHGRPAKAILTEVGLWPREGWRLASDHARRGLVVEAPDGVDPAVALDWLVTAALALTSEPMPAQWRATCYG